MKKKWEYKCLRMGNDHPELENKLNALGSDSWELCSSSAIAANFQQGVRVLLLIFKREIPESQTTEQVAKQDERSFVDLDSHEADDPFSGLSPS